MFIVLYGLMAWLLGAGDLPDKEQKAIPMQKAFLVGADISMLSQIETLGGVFRKGDQPGDCISLLKDYGANCFRLRLFVQPNHKEGVVNDLDYTLALARRIKAAKAQFLLDFHYSDTWADPGHQGKPEAWANLDFPALEQKVADYTAEVMARFKAEGLLPDIVQVGNEITPGMLWPDGKLGGNGDAGAQWDRFVRLVQAGIRGVKRHLAADDRVRILIHIDRGGDWKTTKWFFENLKKREVAFDIIGQSYYPWWHGSLEAVRDNLRQTAETFGKDILIVETAYPYHGTAWAKKKNMAWPITAAGQKQFLTDLIQTVRATPGGHGIGVLYWYPESLPVSGMIIWNGGETALFDAQGKPLPALESFCIEK